MISSLLISLFYNPLQPVIDFFKLNHNLLLLNTYSALEQTLTTPASLIPSSPHVTTDVTPSLRSRVTTLTNIQSLDLSHVYNSHELSTDYRFQKTQNPIFRYDFRVGHYMTDVTKVLNRHMFTTFNDVTTGLRRASWYFSPEFFTPFKVDVLSYLAFFSPTSSDINSKNSYIASVLDTNRDFKIKDSYLAAATPTSGFYNFFTSLSPNNSFLNLR